jgi:hypothetical protein
MGLLRLFALLLVIGWGVTGIVAGALLMYGWLLSRRRRVHDRLVVESFREGMDLGRYARSKGKWGQVTGRPLLVFRADAPRRLRREVLDENCGRAYCLGWLRGFMREDVFTREAEFEATAAEQVADQIARLEAYANGEYRR